MLEYPETATLAEQCRQTIVGKTIREVLPPTKPHKFCWFSGDPAEYGARLWGSRIASAAGFGIFVELAFDNGMFLSFDDGVNARLLPRNEAPKDYQLLVEFSDDSALVFTVAMYGGITLHDGSYDNAYYRKSKSAISPFDKEYASYYQEMLSVSKPGLSAKAFLATEQRFPGIGNGVLQDILFNAGIHPKRKIGTLTPEDRNRLFRAIVSTLKEMTDSGGRDTEKDLFGNPGGYQTKLSRNTLPYPCVKCGSPLAKEAYLGGAVYFCPVCQPLEK